MAEQEYDAKWAKSVVEGEFDKAKELLKEPGKINELLASLQTKLSGLPKTAVTAFKNVPAMAEMVKCYITREYTKVSPKVVVSLVAAFIYLVKRKDLIPDSVPVVGLVDDIAVVALAIKINEKELKDFDAWQKGHVILRND